MTCKGVPIGEDCKWNSDCNVGLYCSGKDRGEGGVCAKLQEVGDWCKDTLPCVTWARCNFNRCVKMYSLSTTDVTESEYNSELCMSNFTQQTDMGWTCMPGPFLDKTSMRQAQDSQQCKYHVMVEEPNGETFYLENTTCGYPSVHASTCPLKQGDTAYIAHLPLMKKFWDSKPRCHYESPLGCVHA